ncbi:MAG TPA: molybdopterin-dependent oxidoreductase [Ktedonobacteraceae bacterium]|jgi:DMSO/TMAO reductase YedYZ molybdopterin-dependent catalytic subunit
MSPRLTDWNLALATLLAILTGLASLISGSPQEWVVFALHAVAGIWIGLLLWGKLRRVWPRIMHPGRWDRRTIYGLLTLLFVGATLGSGIWWVEGGQWDAAGFNLLNWHILLGIVLVTALLLHIVMRAKRLRRRDLTGRRRLLHFGALLLGSLGLWPAQQLSTRALKLPGASERFTGSRESMSYAGNSFPVSSWVADRPRPLDSQTWHLSLGGAILTAGVLTYEELAAPGELLEATLDCTGGFYSTHRWRGVRVGSLFPAGTLPADARFISFLSITGYRWSLPLEEARSALLATHVEDEPLSHDHGFPLRLIAPGRRGFEWVKWIVRIDVLTAPDPGQVVSIFTSSFSERGRGE